MSTSLSPVLRRADVERVTGLSRSAIYAKQAAHQFPRPIKISARAVGWLESDIVAWLQTRIEARDNRTAA